MPRWQMAEPTPPPTPPPAPAAPPPSTPGAGTESGGASSTTGDANRNQGNKNQGKPRDTFKGKVAGMDGHVFQLAEESRQPTQYTKTMKQFQRYVSVTMQHSTDLDQQRSQSLPNPTISRQSSADRLRAAKQSGRRRKAGSTLIGSLNARATTHARLPSRPTCANCSRKSFFNAARA